MEFKEPERELIIDNNIKKYVCVSLYMIVYRHKNTLVAAIRRGQVDSNKN